MPRKKSYGGEYKINETGKQESILFLLGSFKHLLKEAASQTRGVSKSMKGLTQMGEYTR